MTQISKKYLRKEIEAKVYQIFWETIAETKNVGEAEAFFSKFFSKTEKVNFAKRLSIAVLLGKRYEWRQIVDMLRVSLASVAKIAAKMETRGFKVMLAKMEKKEEWRKFWLDVGKTYLRVIHPEKVANLDDEGIEKFYFGRKKTF